MPYIIKETSSPLKIEERECASGPKIKFTTFTSCIGVIAKKGEKLTAVHLSIYAEDGSIFEANDVPKVIDCLPDKPDTITLFGCLNVWQNPANGMVQAAFEKLASQLMPLAKYQQYPREDGTYGAEIDDAGEIKITF